jgi:hypothetical protein
MLCTYSNIEDNAIDDDPFETYGQEVQDTSTCKRQGEEKGDIIYTPRDA